MRNVIQSRRKHRVAWGFIDQGFSSATNFGLSLIAGRLLGPHGLGIVFLGFSVYLIVLSLQRSLLTEVLLVVTTTLDPDERRRTASLGLALSLLIGIGSSGVMWALGGFVSGGLGEGLIAIAPWMPALLAQDYWRNVLFRERRAAAAAANDGIWLVVMAAAMPLAWALRTTWAVVGVWGVGAAAGAIAGYYQTRVGPSIAGAFAWWRNEAWPFGRWNAAASIVTSTALNASAFILAAILGDSALGGFRAVQSLFAPLSLIAPALSLPGLPAVARAYAHGIWAARLLAMRLSAIAVGVSLVFFITLFLWGTRLLPALFGTSFDRYREIIPAVAVGQIFAAAGVGFPILIKVQRRGAFLFASRLVATTLGLGILTLAAARYGLTGAAWGTSVGLLISTIAFAIGAFSGVHVDSRAEVEVAADTESGIDSSD
jgi:O-antigen/teichoic acid export membrane protein